jgi:hypothetical protein
MDKALTTALDANIVNVALVVAAIAVLTGLAVVLIGGNIVYRIIGSLTKQINVIVDQQAAQSRMNGILEVQGNQLGKLSLRLEEMVGILLRGQDIQREQSTAILALGTSLRAHEDKSEERSQALISQLNQVAGDITNLIGDTGQKVTDGTARVIDTLRTVLDSMIEVKTSVEEAKAQSHSQQQDMANTQRRALDAIDVKLGMVSEQVIDVIQAIGEINHEEQAAVDGGGDSPAGGHVSVDDTSGSTIGNGTGNTGDSSANLGKPNTTSGGNPV